MGRADRERLVGARGEPRERVTPPWLEWVRRLQTIAQAGLTFASDPHDVERYSQVRRVAAEIAAGQSGADADVIEGFLVHERGYPTPKIDVRAAVIFDQRILLVRERDDGGWALPGGWADIGDSPAESVERETREEAGVEVRAVKLIALYDRERHGHPRHAEYSYKAIFACEVLAAPEPRAGFEVDGVAFFDPAELPPLSAARVMPEYIALAFEHRAHPDLPTAFD